MSAEFSFKDFCKEHNLPEKTITLLEKEHFCERDLICAIDIGWIAELDIPTGEQKRLELAVNKLRASGGHGAVDGAVGGAVGGATGSLFGGGAFGGARVKQEPKEPVGAAFEPRTDTLAKDRETKILLESFLSNQSQIGGLRDLLALAGIQSDATSQAIVPKGEKPLLIKDFIKSTFNCQYREEEKVRLSDSTDIVVRGKSRKPEVAAYTVELWCAANHKIILHLIKQGTPSDILARYVEYSSWISDYFELYVHKGVFLLDEQHRIRVASEGRSWNDLYFHDISQFLVVRKPSFENQSSGIKGRQSSKSKRVPRRKTLDSRGVPCCFNYNSAKGCDVENCTYTHLCSNPGCLANHSSMDCPRVGPRLHKQ